MRHRPSVVDIYFFFYSSRHIMADEALPLGTVKEKEKRKKPSLCD